jgi:hypothetical protein
MSVRVFGVSAATLLLQAAGMVVAQAPVSREPRLETFQSAALDANGNLAIALANGMTVTVWKEGEQTSFSVPILSSSKGAVGAQAMFPNSSRPWTFRSPARRFRTRNRCNFHNGLQMSSRRSRRTNNRLQPAAAGATMSRRC